MASNTPPEQAAVGVGLGVKVAVAVTVQVGVEVQAAQGVEVEVGVEVGPQLDFTMRWLAPEARFLLKVT